MRDRRLRETYRPESFAPTVVGFAALYPPYKIRPAALHAVALEHLLAGGTQPGAILLQAPLHGAVVTQLLAAQAGRIARTGLLLLRRT
jgi:hypothetical protein